MEFVDLIGRVDENSSFIQIKIKDGNNNDSIGDQIWISPSGELMEVYEHADKDVLKDTMKLFKGNHRYAFKGALLRMGVEF